MRWAHVLCDNENKVFFCDLESLEIIDVNNENLDDVVWEQLEILVKPILVKSGPTEDNLNSCLQWMRNNLAEVVSIVSTCRALKDLMGAQDKDVGDVLNSLIKTADELQELSSDVKVCLQAIWFWKKQAQEQGASDHPDSPDSRDSRADISEPSLKTDRSETEFEAIALEPKRKRLQALQGNQKRTGE